MLQKETITITVVILAYNEAKSLPAVFREIEEELRRLGESFEILIVDDGSTDGTSECADELARPVAEARVIHHPENRGLGEGYRTGFVEAKGDLVTFYPADGQFGPSMIPDYFREIQSCDFVLGKFAGESPSLSHAILSTCELILNRILFGCMPTLRGIMMFRRELLDRFELTSRGRGWGIVIELINRAARSGARFSYCPQILRPRASGKSKVRNLRTIWANVKQLLELRMRL